LIGAGVSLLRPGHVRTEERAAPGELAERSPA
jgi:hypothetical protein